MSDGAVLLVAVVVVLCQLPTTVHSCDPNCASTCLKNPTGCDDFCGNGYGINYDACTCEPCSAKCTGPCNSCGPGLCDRYCVAGYSAVNCICVMCASNCLDCSVNGYLKCNTGGCAKGFAFDSTSKVCTPCDANCSPTVGCTQPSTCSAGGCKDPGFAQVLLTASTTVYTCNPCDVNCAGSCKLKGQNKCDERCKVGYSLNSTSFTCYPCSPYCTSNCTLEGRGFCDASCATGYAWSPAAAVTTKHACYPCANHCTSGCTKKGCCGTATVAAACNLGTATTSSTDPTCTVCS